MIDSTFDYLRPADFGRQLGLQKRRTAEVLGQLEALGFNLPPDMQGARLVHPVLAAAVKAARAAGHDLAVLRADPTLRRFLAPSERGKYLDPLSVLINASAELAILRCAVSALSDGLDGLSLGEWRMKGWRTLSLPDPRGEL